jgi:hypothetical protein
MRVLLFAVLLATTSALLADDSDPDNANSKYTVESVSVLPQSAAKRVTSGLQAEIDALVGQKFDPAAADKLRERLSKELNRDVERVVERGDKPEHVKVIYATSRTFQADADVTKMAYHSKHGWTGGLRAPIDFGPVTFRVGLQSDSDSLLERYAGYTLGMTVRGGDRVRAQLDFGAFHTQWNNTTLRALEGRPDVPGIYRERYIVAPSLAIAIADPLVVTVGVDIQNFQIQFPAARIEASNAVTTTLRYRRRWSSDASRQEVDAGYGLRAATRSLGSDYVYTRHAMTADYKYEFGHHVVSGEFLAGRINGAAPLFDRYTLGDTRTLRGWTKFDLAPLGGTRVAHGSLEYSYRALGFFYDAGAVWDELEGKGVKHSAGIAFGEPDGIFIALAFPLRTNSVAPLFILGMNF